MQTALANDATLGKRVAHGRLLWVGPLAGLSAVGAMPRIDVSGRGPITLGAVAFESFVPAHLAADLFALIGLLTRRPVMNIRVPAAPLAPSFVGPPNLPKAPAVMIASLLIMHEVAAVLIVGVLTTLARKDRRERIANGKPEKRRRIGR